LIYKGGCQCGEIRFEVSGELGQASICHCRMCQKAYGNFFAPLVSVNPNRFKWTKVEPKRFDSSNFVRRGFCSNCGTPLTYESPESFSLSIAAFDKPELIEPVIQYGDESRIKYIDNLNQWPSRSTPEDYAEAPYLKDLVSFQCNSEP
jgi:hypothetical protein